MADLEFAVSIVFRIIPIILHSFGIYLLSTTTFKKPWQKIQGRYMIWLSVSEIIISIGIITYALTRKLCSFEIPYNIEAYVVTFFGLQFCSVLMSITIDRLFFVWLNVRYDNTLGNKIFIGVFAVSQLVPIWALILLYYYQGTTESSGLWTSFTTFKSLYLWPVVDGLVLITYVICYIIIIKIIGYRSKNLFGAESKLYKKRMKKAILVPNLIIWSYIICFITLDIIKFTFTVSRNRPPLYILFLSNVLYGIGLSLDALLYILFTPTIRKALKRKLCCVRGENL